MRTSQPADQSVTGARSGGQVPAFAALSRYRARATLHEYSHPSAYRAFPQAAQRRLRLRGNICAPTVATAQPMRASNHIPVAKICARIENINEVWLYNADNLITNYTGPEGSLTFTYNHNGQLTGVSGARNETYTYDANGNRNMSGYIYGTG